MFNVFLGNLSCIQKKNKEKQITYAKDMAVFLRGEFRITNVTGLIPFYFWQSRDLIKRFLEGEKPGLRSTETKNSVASQIFQIRCI